MSFLETPVPKSTENIITIGYGFLSIFDEQAIISLDNIISGYDNIIMIKSFADKKTEELFNRFHVKGLPSDVQRPALRKLIYFYQAHTLKDLMVPPGNHLETLKGDRQNQHSIRINNQWRICFHWNESDAFDVEIVDYH